MSINVLYLGFPGVVSISPYLSRVLLPQFAGLKKIDRDLEVLNVLYLPPDVEHRAVLLHHKVDLEVDHQDHPVVQDHVEVRGFKKEIGGCWLLVMSPRISGT